MRTVRRTRRYVPGRMMTLLSPLFVYNVRRDAYVLRGVGRRVGPVLVGDRRRRRELPPDLIELRRDTRSA
jgi:hypothetical protein